MRHLSDSIRSGVVVDGVRKFLLVIVAACLPAMMICSPLAAQDHPAPAAKETAGHDDHASGANPVAHGEGHGEEHGADSHHGPYSIKSDLPFWSAVAFIGFVIALKVLGLWDLLLNSMSDREKAEGEAIALAEGNLTEAQATLRRSKGRIEALDEQIRETMAEAERDAQSTRNEIFQIAEKEAKASVERATVEIERVRDQSLNEIFETVATKVTEAAEHRLRSGLQAEDHQRLVDSMLGDLAIR